MDALEIKMDLVHGLLYQNLLNIDNFIKCFVFCVYHFLFIFNYVWFKLVCVGSFQLL